MTKEVEYIAGPEVHSPGVTLKCSEIMKIPAGRKLDKLVANHVLGQTVYFIRNETRMDDNGWMRTLPRFSENIGDAWYLIEAAKKHPRGKFEHPALASVPGGGWVFTITHKDNRSELQCFGRKVPTLIFRGLLCARIGEN